MPQSPPRPTPPTSTVRPTEIVPKATGTMGERMRHTWDSIHEHLGLPASAMPTSPADTGTGFDAYTMAANMSRIMPDGTPMDA
jgi:hypothetical protein